MDNPARKTIHQLESCGLQFARIPQGAYSVGLDPNAQVKLLAKPPRIDWYEPAATPSQPIAVGEFWISTDVLRLSHWQSLLSHADLPRLGDLLPDISPFPDRCCHVMPPRTLASTKPERRFSRKLRSGSFSRQAGLHKIRNGHRAV